MEIDTLSSPTQLAELGAVIGSTIGLVPDGVVVFLPSYAFLDKVKAVWGKSGLLERLSQKKQVCFKESLWAGRILLSCFRSSTNPKRLPKSIRPCETMHTLSLPPRPQLLRLSVAPLPHSSPPPKEPCSSLWSVASCPRVSTSRTISGDALSWSVCHLRTWALWS